MATSLYKYSRGRVESRRLSKEFAEGTEKGEVRRNVIM